MWQKKRTAPDNYAENMLQYMFLVWPDVWLLFWLLWWLAVLCPHLHGTHETSQKSKTANDHVCSRKQFHSGVVKTNSSQKNLDTNYGS